MGTTAEKLAYLNDTKTAIRDAIVAKGVEVPEGTPFRQYAEKVGEIETGGPFLAVEKSVGAFYQNGFNPRTVNFILYANLPEDFTRKEDYCVANITLPEESTDLSFYPPDHNAIFTLSFEGGIESMIMISDATGGQCYVNSTTGEITVLQQGAYTISVEYGLVAAE